jgi:hypothetical protein
MSTDRRKQCPCVDCGRNTLYFVTDLFLVKPGSSVSIVSGYGLDDLRSSFDLRQMRKNFSSSGAHAASCPMGTGSPSPGAKAQPRRDAHLVLRLRTSRSYTASLPKRLRGV